MKIVETKTGLPVGHEYVRKKTGALVQCPGSAHSNPHIDNCGMCAPRWGEIEELEHITLERAYEILSEGYMLSVNDVADRRYGRPTVYDVLRDDPQIEMVNLEKKLGKKRKKSSVNYNAYRATSGAREHCIQRSKAKPTGPVDVEINWEVVHVQIEQIKRRGWSCKFTWHKTSAGEEWAAEIGYDGSVVRATDRELSAAIAKAVLHAGAESP